MKVKVIGIGNRIMRDDGIGVLIVESLKEDLGKQQIEVIVGETDVDYCLSYIEDGDFLFIVDAAIYGLRPGELTIRKINSGLDNFEKSYSQHQLSLVKLLNSYPLKKISGYVIGIEVLDIDFGLELSHELKDNFKEIKNKVYDFIISQGV